MQENFDGGKYISRFRNGLDGSRDFFAAPNGLWSLYRAMRTNSALNFVIDRHPLSNSSVL
ncbi:hypothetical protein AAG906_010792 [Vitis piasezkii]